MLSSPFSSTGSIVGSGCVVGIGEGRLGRDHFRSNSPFQIHHLVFGTAGILVGFLGQVVAPSHIQQRQADGGVDGPEGIKILPEKEKLLNIRWMAYRSRVIMVSTVGVAIVALLGSMAQFTFPQILEGIMPIKSTPWNRRTHPVHKARIVILSSK